MSNSALPFVSVIIPVFNDTERLKTCLQALEQQTYPKHRYEVVVVDNGSDDDVASVAASYGQAIAVSESQRGSYAARNRGIAIAQGEVLAFTDSDCIPVPGWIDAGVRTLLSVPNCGLAAGKIELFFKDRDRPTAVELYDSVTFLQQQRYVEQLKFGATANLFTHKQVFENVGLFNQSLKSGGDYEWGQRVFAAGYPQLFAEEACILHPARHSFQELHRKLVRVTRGLHDLDQTSKNPSILFFQKLIKDLLPPFRILFRIQSDRRLPGLEHKIKFIYALMFVKYASAWARIRSRLSTNF